MKTQSIVLAILFACCQTSFAQTASSGIYLTAEDFSHSKLTAMPDAGQKQCIRLNELFNQRHITVVTGGRKKTFSKDSVFGFRTCDGTTYRLFQRSSYQLLNDDHSLMLYRQSLAHGDKGAHAEVNYYFSKDALSPVVPLTKENISLAWGEDSGFAERVTASFVSDEDLIQYDARRKAYRLNLLLAQTNQSARNP